MSDTNVQKPKWADEGKITVMQSKAHDLLVATKEKAGPALTRVIEGIGAPAQKQMASANDVMSGSINDLLKGLDGKSPTGERLVELRTTMDELNPHSLHNSWWFSWMPTGIKRKAIARFVGKYQPMQSHVNAIFDGLRNGKDELLESSLTLEHQYNEVLAAKKEIESEIYVGEYFIQELEKRQAEQPTDDPQEKQKIESVKNQAMRRIRDLRTMEQAAVQFFISIEQTIATNALLGEQIDSALLVGPMVMTNALQIQAALAKQKSVQEAVDQFQSGLGDMMAQNAAATNQAAQSIGDMYNSPVIAIEKLEEGFDQLMAAVNTANEAMANSTTQAREVSDRLAAMTKELEPVAAGLHEARISKGKMSSEAIELSDETGDVIEGDAEKAQSGGGNNDRD
ncbi:toxic anion resistance protein [Neptuniibacter sp. SY11_33]|uniref:toxic anion resistance protein n=1 Tax=Neptuniibacter sp. SY11_33 TaxID=3398215 RepID=UPI0039F55E9E